MMLPYWGTVGLCQILAYAVLDVDFFSGSKSSNLQELLVLTTFSMVGTVLFIKTWNDFVDRERKWSFSIDWLGIKLGVLVPAVILGLGLSILAAADILEIVKVKMQFGNLLTSGLLFLAVAVTEEVLMRYYVLRNLMISFHPVVALTTSSLLFASLHFANPSFSLFAFFNLFLAGVFLGLPYLYNQNLSFPIIGHFVWNFVQGPLLGFEVSGRDISGVLQLDMSSENYWNGGSFGFEGSIICSTLLILGILIVRKAYNSKLQ
ncbi:MAG: CPBP family intramembrane glutamic endopeptidase [Bacteroidota bacterium]